MVQAEALPTDHAIPKYTNTRMTQSWYKCRRNRLWSNLRNNSEIRWTDREDPLKPPEICNWGMQTKRKCYQLDRDLRFRRHEILLYLGTFLNRNSYSKKLQLVRFVFRMFELRFTVHAWYTDSKVLWVSSTYILFTKPG